jgi:chaperonin GroES
MKSITGTFVPFDARVLVEPHEEDTTHHGLVIPESELGWFRTGTVQAKGPGRHLHGERVEVQCDVGDTVLFARNTGVEVTLNGLAVRIMTENDIFGAVR